MQRKFVADPKPKFGIGLPNGKKVGLGDYVAAWRRVKASKPNALFHGFYDEPRLAEVILREMRRGLQDRINRRLPWWDRGRKWEPIWQLEMLRAARDLNTPRLVIHWLPPDLKRRFADRLRDQD